MQNLKLRATVASGVIERAFFFSPNTIDAANGGDSQFSCAPFERVFSIPYFACVETARAELRSHWTGAFLPLRAYLSIGLTLENDAGRQEDWTLRRVYCRSPPYLYMRCKKLARHFVLLHAYRYVR